MRFIGILYCPKPLTVNVLKTDHDLISYGTLKRHIIFRLANWCSQMFLSSYSSILMVLLSLEFCETAEQILVKHYEDAIKFRYTSKSPQAYQSSKQSYHIICILQQCWTFMIHLTHFVHKISSPLQEQFDYTTSKLLSIPQLHKQPI